MHISVERLCVASEVQNFPAIVTINQELFNKSTANICAKRHRLLNLKDFHRKMWKCCGKDCVDLESYKSNGTNKKEGDCGTNDRFAQFSTGFSIGFVEKAQVCLSH